MSVSTRHALAAAAALALPAAAAAHHGWGWTEDKESRLSGTIQSISFGNPHMHLQLRTDDGLWEVDLSPPIVAQGSGFGPDAAKTGDTAIVTGHRARDGKLRAFKGETITVRGKTYDVYPQREKTL
ncbi:hypothetical protein H0274_12540 [Altererythrobacter sp. CC-YST694]|uniref:DUF6152 family protein n=1 Tax=Altererythrobacter sp. CC-YST694 TaxID=2755038 RepID=UPI001D012B37|nr:DUF6152 family protein [Altererythrobacter sp. CC-YST694]MCB5426089.1 hypothetical protein [Altererythrobacter sp. CC-YST694]